MDSTLLIPRVLHLQKNGYELRIVRNLTDVVIEAENSEISQLYSKILSDAEIKQFDNVFYNTPATFHKILKEGFEGGHDHIEATIDQQALITLITKFQVAGKYRQATIQIQLAEKQLDPMKECERVLMKLDEQRPDERGDSEKQFLSLFKRMFKNQQMLVNRVEEIGQNGVNKSIVLKDKKYDGIETLEERLKKIEEQIEEINEVVSDGLLKADHDIVDLKKSVDLLTTEVHKKLESSLEKVIEETIELEKRQKKLENESGQGNEFKQRIEVVEGKMNGFETLNNLIADTQVKAVSFNSSIEEIRSRMLKHSHEDLERKIKKAVENPERETRGESSVSDAKLDAINKSIEELVNKVKAISDSARSEEALQNERYNEFVKVSADTEKKLVLIKENFVNVEHRLKSLEEEARKTERPNNRVAAPEEVKIEGNRKEVLVEPRESIISRSEEPVFRKDRSKPGLEIQAKFNPNFFDGDLKFTHENRALESPPGITIDRTLLAKNPLPKTGKYCVSIKYGNLVKNANGLFAIGVAVESIKDTGNILAPGCFFITPFEKVAYINCVDINYPSANLKPDDVICMIIDREDNLIAFEIAGKVVIEDRLNPDFFENQDLYPCIFIYQCSNVKISFI